MTSHKQSANTLVLVKSGDQLHPSVGLWNTELAPQLREAVVERELGGFKPLIFDIGFATAHWDTEPYDPFLNINRPEDLQAAKVLLDRF